MNIGKNIKKYRKKLKITQDTLARKADIPYVSLVNMENSRVKNPGIDSVAAIAKALGITVDELIK